ncbi:MAG: VWA domain-containing protein [Myxococcales bacterium]|nr:VWA domain-containing protein [Myxococcales bacterium]
MGIDEKLFRWLYGRIGAWRGRESKEIEARAVSTATILATLRVMAGAAAERDLRVELVDDGGGVAGDTVLLPARVTTLPSREDNERLLLVRATFAGAIVRAGLTHGASAGIDRASLADLEAALREELPGWGALRDRLPRALSLVDLAGYLRPGSAASPVQGSEQNADDLPRPTTERDAKRRPPPARKRRLTEDEEGENPFTHSFEKVHTAEEHKGGNKRADGSDQLDDQLAALDALDPDEVVLSRERTRSVYRSDFVFDGSTEARTDRGPGLCYDEWDSGRRRYLARHCAVTVEAARGTTSGGVELRRRIASDERRAVGETRARVLRIDAARRWHTRQSDGPDVDLDALVERSAALRAGHDGATRLYVSRRRRGPSLAALLLIDGSLSTDAWVANRRVLDVERDAATIVGLAFEGLIDELAMASFCSFSHEDCRFTPIKAFKESLQKGLERLAALEPRGYTRVGPALRHATRVLERAGAQRRVIVLFSDGKPTDTDRYEGRHGIGDVRQAVREAKERGVDVFALSVDPRSRPLLPRMFGAHSFAGLSSARDVAHAVGVLCTKMQR